ncbi:MAG TPA: magnesium/cobalt transporter CorA [Blastocatellia bacterium]|nr:magnesium/cobalt transporter CorA [Blastocatellia bacterium]
MISTLVLDRSTKTFTHVSNPDLISDHCGRPSDILWVDVTDPTSEDFDELAREFGFHPLSIEDCRHQHQRPKVEEYPGYYFIVIYEAEMQAGCQLELRELGIFLGVNYLVTVHSRPIRNIEKAQQTWRYWTDLAERKTGLPAYLLMDAIVDDYMPMLDDFSDRLEELEAQVFENFQPEALHDIFRIKKQLIFLRRAVVPLRDVFNTLLRREQPVFSRETMIYFQDVYDHLIRVADSIDSLRDIVGSTMEAYLSVSGNRTNFVMKRLTSIATILMTVTLVAGIYGMNFNFMPELRWRYGYIGALISMAVIALALYLYFRKIKWL